MGGSAHLNFSVGAVVAAGGIYAFVKRKSMPSLVGGVVIGGAIIGGGVLISKGSLSSFHIDTLLLF